MAKEIEKKFLVNLDKLSHSEGGADIKQAYIATTDNTVVRVRIAKDKAYLTLKGENVGITRSEFEYEISMKDANDIMAELCSGPSIEKTRYVITHKGHAWELDIFHGDNDGLVIAEIELQTEDEYFEKPDWVGGEVSGDPKYYNSSLLQYPFKQW